MAGPVEMARLVSIRIRRQNSVGLWDAFPRARAAVDKRSPSLKNVLIVIAGDLTSSNVSYFRADFCLRRRSYATLSKERILKIVSAENFGESYALTLREWRRRFLEKWLQVERLGFDAPLRRLWECYLLSMLGRLPISHDRRRPLFHPASSRLS